jgi:RHS repeat-associated protein
LPRFDANVSILGVIKDPDGIAAATHEYDTLANYIRESGTYALNDAVSHSAIYTDFETDLVNYGQRFYSPSLGRFINKDPIEEAGVLNLYGFCGNNGVNSFDYLGSRENDNSNVLDFIYRIPHWRNGCSRHVGENSFGSN